MSTSTAVAPVSSALNRSVTDMSKLNDDSTLAWSAGVIACRVTWWRTWNCTVRWFCRTPLGRPVDPDVYSTYAGLSGVDGPGPASSRGATVVTSSVGTAVSSAASAAVAGSTSTTPACACAAM